MADQMPRAWATEWAFPFERLDDLCNYCDELRTQFGVDVLRDDELAAVADRVEPLRNLVCTAALEVIIPGLHALMLRHLDEAQHLRPRRRQEVVRLVTRLRHAVTRLLRAHRCVGSRSYIDLVDALHAACVQVRKEPYHIPELKLALQTLAVNIDRTLELRDPAAMLRFLASTLGEVLELLHWWTFAPPPPTTRGAALSRLRGRHEVAAQVARWTAEHSPDGRVDWTATAKIMLIYLWPLWTHRRDTPALIGDRLRKGVASMRARQNKKALIISADT
jgi:hypothetical protein